MDLLFQRKLLQPEDGHNVLPTVTPKNPPAKLPTVECNIVIHTSILLLMVPQQVPAVLWVATTTRAVYYSPSCCSGTDVPRLLLGNYGARVSKGAKGHVTAACQLPVAALGGEKV